MQIGILVTGAPRPPLQPTHGTFESMTRRLLAEADPGFSIQSWDVRDGDDAFPPAPEACDGWVVTGSPHGVYEDLPWMRRLQDFLRACDAAGIPTVGICFGHQILAAAHGGRVEKVDRGHGVGPHTYRLAGLPQGLAPATEKGEGAPESITLLAFHQDQVVAPPPGARVLAESDFCPFAALEMGRAALSFQGHPEFSAAFETDLVALLKGTEVEAGRAEAALSALSALGTEAPDARLDSARVGRWIAAFLRTRAAEAARPAAS